MWPVSYNSTSSLLSMIRTFGPARCAATHSVLTSASGWAYSVEDIIRETTQRKPVRNQTLLVRRVWCLYHRDDRCRLGGLRSLVAAGSRHQPSSRLRSPSQPLPAL